MFSRFLYCVNGELAQFNRSGPRPLDLSDRSWLSRLTPQQLMLNPIGPPKVLSGRHEDFPTRTPHTDEP